MNLVQNIYLIFLIHVSMMINDEKKERNIKLFFTPKMSQHFVWYQVLD